MSSLEGQMHKSSKDPSLLILPIIPHLRAVFIAHLLFCVFNLANLRIHFTVTLKFKCVLAQSVLAASGGPVY
jgi:hypothetical protein